MSQAACALCQPLVTPIVRESDLWRTALNRNQNLLGKLIVVLRRHAEAVTQLSADEWAALFPEVTWATARLSAAFAPDHYNYAFLQNMDRHVHLHVIPRYAGARRVAGHAFADPDFPGHYRVPGQERIVDQQLLGAIAAAIRSRAGR